MLYQRLDTAVAEDRAHGPQQIQRQIGMAIRETIVPLLRQPPILPRPSPPFAPVFAPYESRGLELEEVLTGAGRGHGEARGDIGGGPRSARLQLKQDAILTAFLVLTHVPIL